MPAFGLVLVTAVRTSLHQLLYRPSISAKAIHDLDGLWQADRIFLLQLLDGVWLRFVVWHGALLLIRKCDHPDSSSSQNAGCTRTALLPAARCAVKIILRTVRAAHRPARLHV